MQRFGQILLAGPWVGEFGWELMGWQARLRFLSKTSDVIVACQMGHESLYQDFAKDIVYFDPPQGSPNMWTRTNLNLDFQKFWSDNNKEGFILKPTDMSNKEQDFITYGKVLEQRPYDILIHARSTDNLNTGYRNWPISNWNQFVEYFKDDYRIVSIGSLKGAHWINGTIDERGIPLDLLATYMRNALLTIGPSSGPMHFASLCGCPHLVWTAKNTVALIRNKERYERIWNPHDTEVRVIEGVTWQPDIMTVYALAYSMLRS